jgi:hypothetical protein
MDWDGVFEFSKGLLLHVSYFLILFRVGKFLFLPLGLGVVVGL